MMFMSTDTVFIGFEMDSTQNYQFLTANFTAGTNVNWVKEIT